MKKSLPIIFSLLTIVLVLVLFLGQSEGPVQSVSEAQVASAEVVEGSPSSSVPLDQIATPNQAANPVKAVDQAPLKAAAKQEVDPWQVPGKLFTSKDLLKVGKGAVRIDAEPLKNLFTKTSGSKVTLDLNGETLSGKVTMNEQFPSYSIVAMKVEEFEDSMLILVKDANGRLQGDLKNPSGSVAYQLVANQTNESMDLVRVNITDIICGTSPKEGLPGTFARTPPEGAERQDPPASGGAQFVASDAALSLQSDPGKSNVIYLDFDGEIVTGTRWNAQYGALDMADAGIYFNDTAIQEIWYTVSNDFAPFNVNVTTDRGVYDSTPVDRRMMCVFTDTNFTGFAAGVAFLNSFGDEAAKVCWVFTADTLDTVEGATSTASHELGHTFGLTHDGRNLPDGNEEYYRGHGVGDFRFGPIMGGDFFAAITVWDNGSYPLANNSQDDINQIATYLGKRFDNEVGIVPLPLSISGDVSLDANFDFSGSRGEIADEYEFTTSGGRVVLDVIGIASDAPIPAGRNAYASNLDLFLEVRTLEGDIVASADPTDSREASLEFLAAPGTYILKVGVTSFAGGLDADDAGYPTYGQMGNYFLTGNVNPGTGLFVTPSSINFSVFEKTTADPVTLQIGAIDDETYDYTLEVTGTHAIFVSLSSSSGTVSDEIDEIIVSFDTEDLPIGTYTATIEVSSPAFDDPFSIPVSFTVIPPSNFDGISINSSGEASPYPSVISVGTGRGALRQIEVTLNGLTHGSPGDLQVLLVTPSNREFLLIDNDYNRRGVSNETIKFSIDGRLLPQGFLFSGTFLPMGANGETTPLAIPAPSGPYGMDLRDVSGDPAEGDYKLYVYDKRTGDAGTIGSWSVNLVEIADSDTEILDYSEIRPGWHSLTFTSAPGVTYSIEASANLTVWREIQKATANAAETTIVFPSLPSDAQYFRVRRVR